MICDSLGKRLHLIPVVLVFQLIRRFANLGTRCLEPRVPVGVIAEVLTVERMLVQYPTRVPWALNLPKSNLHQPTPRQLGEHINLRLFPAPAVTT